MLENLTERARRTLFFARYEAAQAGATVLLAASVFHFKLIEIPALKQYLRGKGVHLAG